MTQAAASAGRRVLEGALRAVAILSLGALLLHSLSAQRTRRDATAGPGEVEEALVQWSTSTAPGAVHVDFSTPPSPEVRAWLAAFKAVGTRVGWSGEAPLPTAVSLEPVPDPRRPVQLWVAGPAGAGLSLADRLGTLGEFDLDGTGASLQVPYLEDQLNITVSIPGQPDTVALPEAKLLAMVRDSLHLRPLLLLGEAGWEAKFVLAALEERGWSVHARLAVAPSGDLRQGPEALRIDTAHYAAVIALDSVAARHATALRRYVDSGGGALVLGEAAALPDLAPILPAVARGTPIAPRPFAADSTMAPRRALSLTALGDLKPGAVVLEHRDQAIAAAAWRLGEGRVLQVGYHDTWRWRLAGNALTAAADHRAWLAALVSSVAHAPRIELPAATQAEPTPLATLVAALGPRTAPDSEPGRLQDDPRLVPLLMAISFAALMLEWAARRQRGAR